MMSEHVTSDDLRRLRNGTLPAPRVLMVTRHIATCSACAELARGSGGDEAPSTLLLAFGGGAEHPDAEALSNYVDGGRREDVEEHLRVCAMCRAEADDLAKFRLRIAPRRWWIVVASTAAIVVAAFLVLILRPSRPAPRPGVIKIQSPSQPARPAEWEALVAGALGARRVEAPPFLREIRGRREDVRGSSAPAPPATLQPAGVVVASDRPRFTWTAKGKHAVVSIFDGAQRVARSRLLADSEWIPPAPLPRGRTYQWQVELHNGGRHIIPAPPDPPAAFRVMDEASYRDVTAARQQRPDDHLLLGVLYARAGAQQEAAKELAAYRESHPEDIAAQQLVESVQAW